MDKFKDGKGTRWALVDGQPLIGVTTALSVVVPKSLRDYWLSTTPNKAEVTLTNAGNNGTIFHNMLEAHWHGTPYKETTKAQHRVLFANFQRWITKFDKAVPVEVEADAIDSSMLYAGTGDLVIDVTEHGITRRELWDYKTSRQYSIKTGWQLAAYLKALNKREPYLTTPIVGMRGIHCSYSTGEITDFEYVHIDFCYKAFLASLSAFIALEFNNMSKYGIKLPDGTKYRYSVETLSNLMEAIICQK